MFATPNPARARSGGRRSLELASGGGSSQNRNDDGDLESPVPRRESFEYGEMDAGTNSEVLSILRSLQQQVSALQAQQLQAQQTQSTRPRASESSVATAVTNPAVRKKLPKDLTVSVEEISQCVLVILCHILL